MEEAGVFKRPSIRGEGGTEESWGSMGSGPIQKKKPDGENAWQLFAHTTPTPTRHKGKDMGGGDEKKM